MPTNDNPTPPGLVVSGDELAELLDAALERERGLRAELAETRVALGREELTALTERDQANSYCESLHADLDGMTREAARLREALMAVLRLPCASTNVERIACAALGLKGGVR